MRIFRITIAAGSLPDALMSSRPPMDGPPGATPSVREYTTQVLFGGRTTCVIVHNGERYILRITTNDRLILTK